MKRFLGSTLLLAMFAAHVPIAGAQDTFQFAPFELPLPPGQGPGFGLGMPAPHHDVLLMGDSFPGALPMDPMRLVMLAERLELSKEQRDAMGRIMDEASPKMRDLMFRMGDARKELEAALDGGGKDEAGLRALADAQGKLHADLLFLHLSTQQRLQKLLTEEQRARLEDGVFGGHGPWAMHRALRAREKTK